MDKPWMKALDLQLDLIRYWKTPAARRVEEAQYDLRRNWPTNEPHPPADWDYEHHRDVDWLMAVIGDALGTAATYWVASDIVDVIAHASTSLPDTTLHPGDLPAPAGFARLEHPVHVEAMNVLGEPYQEGEGPYLTAMLWTVADLAGEPGVFVSWGDTVPVSARKPDDPWTPDVLPGPHWGLRFGQPLTSNLDRFVLTFFLLSVQRIAQTRQEPVGRQVRRRAARADLTIPEDGIRVVTLRRRYPEQVEAGDEAGEVDWSHRWIVGGHWRDQWYPSLEVHRPVWIAPYVKGPEDRPLVVKDRVYRFVR